MHHPRRPYAAQGKDHRLPRGIRNLARGQAFDLAADHQPDQAGLVKAVDRLPIGDRLAITQHRDAVTDGKDFLQPV